MSKITLISIVLITVFTYYNKGETRNVTRVLLQADGKASKESMLDISTGALPELHEFTTCLHLFLIHTADFIPLINYFAVHDNDLSIGLVWKTSTIVMQCCEGRTMVTLKVPLKLRTWHHMCFAIDIDTRQYMNAFDDVFDSGTIKPEGPERFPIPAGGRLVFGQEMDTIEGEFNIRQSLHGYMAHFQMFSKVLDSSYLKKYVQCQDPTADLEPLLYFTGGMSAFELRGSTNASEVPLEELCQEKPPTRFILPGKRKFHSARDLCHRMKGELTLAESESENKKIFHEVDMFQDECVSSQGTVYWVGVYGDLATGKWLSLSNNTEITWDDFQLGYHSVLVNKRCASIGGISHPYIWYNTNCDEGTCPLCSFPDTASLKIRGLCRDSYIDRSLTLYDYKNKRPHFHGPFYTNLYWNGEDMTWMMKSRAHESLVGVMELAKGDDYPIGIRYWNITGDVCPQSRIQMLITACDTSEYSCSDGSCIAKDKRCDKNVDCSDQSDELDCDITNIPLSYSTHLAPPRIEGAPVAVRIFVGVTSVREINILDFKLALDIIMELRWKDPRLRMKNLRKSFEANKITDPERLWQPTLQIEDGSKSLVDVKPRSKSLMVEREGDAIADDDIRLHEDDVYLGTENTLYLRHINTVSFTCQFQLQRYPFDKQICSLTFRLMDVASDSVILTQHEIGADYLGKRVLLEYRVTKVNMTADRSGDAVVQKMVMEMKNLYGYYISSTYIPTMLLLIICYLTLFFDIEDFTDRVMVSLTSLLVLAALFSQTSQTIPKTAYLKLVDLWFVCLIVMVFVIIVILVVVENVRLSKKSPAQMRNSISVQPKEMLAMGDSFQKAFPMSGAELNRNAIFANFVALVALPIFTTFFFCAYVIVCNLD